MPALPNASYPEKIWNADSEFQDRDQNKFQADPKAEDYQRIAAEIIATQIELTRLVGVIESEDNVVTANSTLDATSELVLAASSTFRLQLTLPDAATADGAIKRIKKTDNSGFPVDVICADGDTIDGDATKALLFQWSEMSIQATETGWYII